MKITGLFYYLSPKWLRRLFPFCIAIILLVGLQSLYGEPGKIVFVSAEGFETTAFAGEMEVPVNRAVHSSQKTKISYLIFRRSSQSPATPPIFYFAGGPGSSGIEFARTNYGLIHRMRMLSDIVVIDQRGCGGNEPRIIAPKNLNVRTDVTLSSLQKDGKFISDIRQWQKTIEVAGIDLSSFNTMENAADIFEVQSKLGYPKINIWAYSYGTHLALAYAKRYPDAVSKMVLAGVSGLDQRVRSPLAMDKVFLRLDSMVTDIPALRRFFPDGFFNTVKECLADLEHQPIVVQDAPYVKQKMNIAVDKYDLCAALSVLGNQPWFPSDMPAFFYNLKRGKAAFAGYYVHALKSKGLGTAMTYSTHVASGYPAGTLEKVEQERDLSIFGNAINFPYMDFDFYNNWTIRDLGEEFREKFSSAIPVLLFSGDLDFRTSPADANIVGTQFTDMRHVIVKNCNHSLWSATPEVGNLMFRFFQGEKIISQQIENNLFQFRSPLDEEYAFKLVMLMKGESTVDIGRTINDFEAANYLSRNFLHTAIDQLMLMQEWKKAEALAHIVCVKYSGDWRSFQKLGEVLQHSAAKKERLAAFNKSLEMNPYNVKALIEVQ